MAAVTAVALGDRRRAGGYREGLAGRGRIMRYGVLFTLLGGGLILQAASLQGWFWVLVWPGISFGAVGLAYLGLGPGIFGKRPDGSMAWHAIVFLLPHLAPLWLTWRLVRAVSREDCSNEVVPGVFVGRRPLAGEIPPEVTLLVDLTAEFPELRAVQAGRQYVSAPMLDTGIAQREPFAELVRQVSQWPGAVYIHCAQGHGRSGTLATAVIVAKGHCATADEAVSMLRAARPRLRLGRNQLAFAKSICEMCADRAETRTAESADSNHLADLEPPRFQFGIRSLLILTGLCAAAGAMAGSLGGPALFRAVVVVYLMSLGTYAVLRLPYVCRRILRSRRQWDRIRRQRAELNTSVRKMQADLQQVKPSAHR